MYTKSYKRADYDKKTIKLIGMDYLDQRSYKPQGQVGKTKEMVYKA
jgi:hypothetical protein